MKIDRFVIKSYGKLKNLDSGENALGPIVVLAGGNEEGKSTCFSFLTSMLLGFQPAKKADHPYTPWYGGEPEGSIQISLSDNSKQEIKRKLLSRPSASLYIGDNVQPLNNQPIPSLASIGRQLYLSIYAISLEKMRELEGQNWQEVQEKLLIGLGQDDLNSIQSVQNKLDLDAKKLWKASKRGKSEFSILEEQRLNLENQLREGQDNEDAKRQLSSELAVVQKEKEILQQKHLSAKAKLRKINRLLPFKKRYDAYKRLKQSLGNPSNLEQLPSALADAWRDLKTKINEQKIKLKEYSGLKQQLQADIKLFSHEDQIIIAAQESIRQMLANYNKVESIHENLPELEGDYELSLQNFLQSAQALISPAQLNVNSLAQDLASSTECAERLEVHDKWSKLLSTPQWNQIRKSLKELENCNNQLKVHQSELSTLELSLTPLPATPILPLSGLLLGIALLIWGSTSAEAWNSLSLAGLLCLCPAILLLIISNQNKSRAARESASRLNLMDQQKKLILGLRAEADAHQKSVSEGLEKLELKKECLDQLTEEHILDLKELAALSKQCHNDLSRFTKKRYQLEELLTNISNSYQALELNALPDAESGTKLALLRKRLSSLEDLQQGAQQNKQLASHAKRELPKLESKLEQSQRLLKDLTSTKNSWLGIAKERSTSLPKQPLDPVGQSGQAQLVEADSLFSQADLLGQPANPVQEEKLMTELAEQRNMLLELKHSEKLLLQNYPDHKELLKEVEDLVQEGSAQNLSDEDIIEAEQIEESCEQEIRQLLSKHKDLEHEQAERSKAKSLSEIASELKQSRIRIAQVKRERDSLALLQEIISASYKEYQQIHQPDIITRASQYLEVITHGKYSKLFLDSSSQESKLRLYDKELDSDLALTEPLSLGLRDQVFLSLRLGIADHLDPVGESLPLFLDESMVNWDKARRSKGLKVLREISKKRQVFLFSFDSQIADELKVEAIQLGQQPTEQEALAKHHKSTN